MIANIPTAVLLWSASFALTPAWVLVVIALGFGLIIGSFLNVYIYRFHTGKSLAGHSHCLSCNRTLRWYDLFPVVSYLALRGRCRACGCRIPSRYLLVELGTALLFVAMVPLAATWFSLLWWWGVVSLLVVIFVYDLYHFIIPDALTATLAGAMLLRLVGNYLFELQTLPAIGADILAAALGAGFFLLLWLVSRGAWLGFGDVKLAFPLGLLVGAPFVFSFVVYSFWVGAAVSLALLVWQRLGRGQARLRNIRKGLTMKSAVPFAPFLIIAALLVVVTRSNVLTLFTFS